jgi:uncharacterized protein YcbX
LAAVPVRITHLSIAPVKGMRVAAVDAVDLTAGGATGDRAFAVVEPDGTLVRSDRNAALLQVAPEWDGRALTLRFPGGEAVRGEPEPGPAGVTRLYDGRELTGRLVDGVHAAALSEHLGRPVRLLARNPVEPGADDAPVTLMSRASLEALAPALGGEVPDARRFRMTLTVDGVEAWEEHGWAGRELHAGSEAVLRVIDPVPRCVVTTHDPDDGRTNAPVLKALARLRGKDDVTFGVWCEVLRPGTVRRGDPVAAR